MPEAAHGSRALRAALRQGLELASTLDAATFARAIPPGPSGVGSHLRHAAGFVQVFLRGLASGRIDYDARERDERLEREPGRAAELLRSLIRELSPREPFALADPVLVRMEAPAGAGPEEHWHPSTVGRELAFLVSHTVHHLALVALALRRSDRAVPVELGVAPSTLAHRSSREPPSTRPLAAQRA